MQDVIDKCLGLVNQFSPITTAKGSLARADNCVNIRENILEDRRGYKVDATLSNNIKNVLAYNGKILIHNGTKISYGLSGSYSDYSGSYSEISGQKIKAIEGAGNLYFTTSLGIKVFTDVSGTAARSSGMPRALDLSYTLTGATGFLSNNFQCAYRATLNRTDANKNVITSYPSSRMWAVNTAGGARNLILTMYLPNETAAGDGVKIYRTAQVSGTSEDTSGDECDLVYQYTISSTDVSNGYITVTDSVTDSLRGEALYTNPSQETISQANERPPLSNDIALFRSSYMFYANTSTKQRLAVTLVGTSSLTGNTFKIAGITYNFGATEIISGGGSPQIKVSATGVAAFDIDETARSLVRVINRYAGNTSVYAYYLSGPDELPGQIMLEEKGVGGSAFTIQASNSSISSMAYPNPPVSPSTASDSTSTNSIQKNALFYSKFQQYEHVPLLNYLLVGPSNKEILRIAPLRESLIIIKEEGVYRLTGENPQSFSVTPLDLTVFCKAPESVCVLSNQVFMLSNQGVVAISETGIQVVSREIEPSLKPLLTNSNLKNYTCGFSYESDRHYLLSTITDVSDSSANQTLVYNVFTKTWVRWTFGVISGVVEPVSDKMYFAKNSSAIIYSERKSFSDSDYADPESTITINSIVGAKINITSSTTPLPGWVLSQGGTGISIDTVTNLGSSYDITIDGDLPSSWTTGSATLYPYVGFDIEYNPWFAGNPASIKQVRVAKILTDNTTNTNSVTKHFATFRSNFDSEIEEVPLTLSASSWGSGPWGNFSWGGGADSNGYPTFVPRNKQYCTRLSVGVRHKKALERISLCGVGLDFESSSDRIGR